MREPRFRRFFLGAAMAAAITVAGTAVPRVANAQDTGIPQTTTDVDDDDTDWGWIGLLGLAGLLGLRRREPHHVDRVDTTTTRRP